MIPYGNFLKIQRLTLNRFLRGNQKFPYGNFLILFDECYGDTSKEIRQHKSR